MICVNLTQNSIINAQVKYWKNIVDNNKSIFSIFNANTKDIDLLNRSSNIGRGRSRYINSVNFCLWQIRGQVL